MTRENSELERLVRGDATNAKYVLVKGQMESSGRRVTITKDHLKSKSDN